MSRDERRTGQRDGRRSRPYARIYVTAKNHRRTADIYSDNDLWATYTRILVEATERHADHTADSMLVSISELGGITGKRRTDVSLKLLERLAEVGVISVERRRNVCSIGVRNFAKRQGFGSVRATHVVPSPTPAPTPAPTPTCEDPRSPRTAGASSSALVLTGDPPEPKPKKVRSRDKSLVLAEEVWPELVERAERYGKHWAPVPHKDQLQKLVARIEEGATRQQLLDAIDGFVSLINPKRTATDGRDMMKFFRATTIYAPTKFRDYLEAAADDGAKSRSDNWLAIASKRAMEAEAALQAEEDARG